MRFPACQLTLHENHGKKRVGDISPSVAALDPLVTSHANGLMGCPWKGMFIIFRYSSRGFSSCCLKIKWHLRLQYSMGILWWKAVESPVVLSTVATVLGPMRFPHKKLITGSQVAMSNTLVSNQEPFRTEWNLIESKCTFWYFARFMIFVVWQNFSNKSTIYEDPLVFASKRTHTDSIASRS